MHTEFIHTVKECNICQEDQPFTTRWKDDVAPYTNKPLAKPVKRLFWVGQWTVCSCRWLILRIYWFCSTKELTWKSPRRCVETHIRHPQSSCWNDTWQWFKLCVKSISRICWRIGISTCFKFASPQEKQRNSWSHCEKWWKTAQKVQESKACLNGEIRLHQEPTAHQS